MKRIQFKTNDDVHAVFTDMVKTADCTQSEMMEQLLRSYIHFNTVENMDDQRAKGKVFTPNQINKRLN